MSEADRLLNDGISAPGFAACGLRIQAARYSGVFGSTPDPIVERLAKWVRSGPTRALAAVPAIAWQLTQVLAMKTSWPRGATELRASAGLRCWVAQASNASRGWATTR